MIQAGDLVATDDGWTLPSDRKANRSGRWTDDEISIAARAYISLLRADHEGRPVHRREAVAEVVDQTGRTADAVNALFANLSAVVQEQGYEFLAAYPPKSNVPAGVRPAVAAILNAQG
ncbi:hypothetical protein [Aeromicrobium sp. UC242_57]|uniref:hypothetical protein n=1 Tax=Aeromicrobium sp. UC242_57 TaxID=3374624 RepID=UPI0037975B19